MRLGEHGAAPTHRRTDYQPPDFLIPEVALTVAVDTETVVDAMLVVERAPQAARETALVLDARELDIDALSIDGEPLDESRWRKERQRLRIDQVPDRFVLRCRVRLRPDDNTALEGFYRSGPMVCTQCEAHGFSRIVPFLDRPDVLSRYRVRLEADASRYPVLLSNGNCVDRGPLEGGRHFAEWEDPFPKPCYLFAMVAGDLACVDGRYQAADGREIALHFYVDRGSEALTAHAIDSLKAAMRWDEERFGLVYDLDTYMVVAARAFNMGAMENKGLNIFNAAYVLASPETATDASFDAISAVIAHEYFHNYTGNRVTCRDWFQLSLKEGLTVFRDQWFSEDRLGGPVQRIRQVRDLRALQFPEDAGPTAHPVRPESYQEVNNFYTATVYEKGAEIVRMLRTRLGETAFSRGVTHYLRANDGRAATIEDFIEALSASSGIDLRPFLAWYAQAGTPILDIRREVDGEAGIVRLHLRQHTPPTPGQADKRALPLPLRLRLYTADGNTLALPAHPARHGDDLLLMESESVTLDVPCDGPLLVAPLLGFSAPVRLRIDASVQELQFLAANETDAFVRWDALQQLQARAHQGLMEDDAAAVEPLLAALQRVASRPPDDAALTAELLSMPGLAIQWDAYARVHPERFLTARDSVRRRIAQALCGPLSVWAQRCPLGLEQAGERALVNVALDYLMVLEPASVRALARRRASGDNMTLAMGALQALGRTRSGESAVAVQQFRQRWETVPLVMDRWFAARAGSPLSSVEDVRKLMSDPLFDWRNPNRVRAVLGSFARDNLGHFHSREGYTLFAEALQRLDASNPQTAARLCRPLLGFRRLASPWAELQRECVAGLRQRIASPDLAEMLDAALAEGV